MITLLETPEILDVPAVAEAGVGTSEPKNSKPSGDDLTEYQYANALAEILPPIKTCGNQWRSYEAGAWSEIERAIFRPDAQNTLPENIRTERRAAALLDHLEGRAQVSAESFCGFNKTGADGSVFVNVGNGVLVVTPSNIKLTEHDPAHNFTARTAAIYNIEAAAPLFYRVLNEALPDAEDRRLYQLCAGNFLLPDSRFEVALINYGEAGSGKSTLAEAIASTLGRDLVPRLNMSQICDSKSYHLPKLRYAAVNLGTELDAIEMGDSASFKALISGEPLEARPIYGAPFTMRTACKLWFLANGLPRFKHGTEAELRRTRFIRFNYIPPSKDVTLKTRLAAERDGIFLWMVEGLRELLTLAEIPLGGKDSRAVHDRFRISNDPVGSFVKQRCRFDVNACADKFLLGAAYDEFCRQHGLPDSCGAWFFRCLYERWPNLTEKRPGSGSSRRRCIAGIALNS